MNFSSDRKVGVKKGPERGLTLVSKFRISGI